MIDKEKYDEYLSHLLGGDSKRCKSIVEDMLDQRIEMLDLYSGLFHQSLYEVGKRWENNSISVAVEHFATAITERLIATAYPRLNPDYEPGDRRAIVSCGTNEFHQVGARMVADVLEQSRWNVRFLGANIPAKDLLQAIDEDKPQLLGLSLGMFFNIAPFSQLVESVQHHFPNLDIIVGGQAFHWGGAAAMRNLSRVTHLPDLQTLNAEVKK